MEKTCGNCRYSFNMENTPIQQYPTFLGHKHGSYRKPDVICTNYHNTDWTDDRIELVVLSEKDLTSNKVCPFYMKRPKKGR